MSVRVVRSNRSKTHLAETPIGTETVCGELIDPDTWLTEPARSSNILCVKCRGRVNRKYHVTIKQGSDLLEFFKK